MTLQEMNKTTQDAEQVQELGQAGQRVGRKRSADRRPSKDQVQRARLDALSELVRDARANGDSLTGPSGLLKDLTKMVLEISLEEEMTEYLGHGKHQ